MELVIKKKYWDAILKDEKRWEMREKHNLPFQEWINVKNEKDGNIVGKIMFSYKLEKAKFEIILEVVKQQTWWDDFCEEYLEKPFVYFYRIQKSKPI
jgi:hypothetical protein